MITRGLLLAAAVLMLAALSPAPSHAQGAQNGTFHYAFATQMGSGIYRVNGRTIQLYRLNVPIRFFEAKRGERDFGLVLRMPLIFGFYNFKLPDIVDTEVPENFGVLALVPALEFEIPARDNWWLGPFGGFGIGKDFQGNEVNWIYSVGLRSLAIWPVGKANLRLGNRLVYTGYLRRDFAFVDDLMFLESGVDIRQAFNASIFGYQLDASLYGINYLYFVSPDLLRNINDQVDLRTEWEVGTTFGTVKDWRILGIKMPRLGIGYRFGSGAEAVRIVIGYPFPIESPRQTDERGFEMQ